MGKGRAVIFLKQRLFWKFRLLSRETVNKMLLILYFLLIAFASTYNKPVLDEIIIRVPL